MGKRIVGLDYLRAFFSVCVVVVHLGYVDPSSIFDRKLYVKHLFTLSDFVNFYILLLAVPVFFIMSHFLYIRKSKNKKRLIPYTKRICSIGIFWAISFAAFEFKGWEILKWLPKSLSDIPIFIMSGGYTIYYFFFVLVCLTVITGLCMNLRSFYIYLFFILSVSLVGVLPLIAIRTGKFIYCIHWSICNFLPYPFAAVLVSNIVEYDNRKFCMFNIALVILAIISIIMEWRIYVDKGFFSINLYAIPPYMRPSLVFLSMIILCVAVRLELKENALIDYMSKSSLALYCLHPFFIEPVQKIVGNNLWIALLIVMSLSYCSAYLLRSFLKEELLFSR